jgi:cell division protein FtsL
MIFIIIVALSALFVACCAAFFSIKGLIALFSGSALAIGVMASSLELGKLVAASFLHTYWKKINFLLKFYLCSAVLVLMCITSLGIFGFLTGAYQVHSAKVNTFDTKIAALVSEKSAVDQAVFEYSTRIKALTEVRATQEQRVQSAGNYKAPRDQAYKAIAEANEEIQKKEVEISQSRQRAVDVEKELAELKISLNTTTDIGSFRFIADALHTDVDTSVQYFIFTLIAVFDPLAVALVLAWNKLVEERAARKRKAQLAFEEDLHFSSSSAASVASTVPTTEVKVSPTPTVIETILPVEILPKSEEKPIFPVSVETPIFEKEVVTFAPSVEAVQHIVPTDSVSNMPIGDASPEEEPEELTEEERKRLLLSRKRSSGRNDSVITS